MSVHVVIVRRVRPGREAEFQYVLREFLHQSLAHEGVWGASMIAPPPGSKSREFGILRTFADEAERDAFYATPLFQAWTAKAKEMTEGDPEYRHLHGMESWFRDQKSPPPRWKMALLTFVGVFPVALFLNLSLMPVVQSFPLLLRSAVSSACMVLLLTWCVMPLVTRAFRRWLSADAGQSASAIPR